MELCQNRKSGDFFICLGETEKEKRRLISPAGTIQSLKCSFFKEAFYINDDDPSVNNLLTDTQVKSYKIYKQSEEDEAL